MIHSVGWMSLVYCDTDYQTVFLLNCSAKKQILSNPIKPVIII